MTSGIDQNRVYKPESVLSQLNRSLTLLLLKFALQSRPLKTQMAVGLHSLARVQHKAAVAVVLDVADEERKRLDVPDLLKMFEKVRGEKLSDDALLLS